MNIVEITREKEAICRNILDALPEWFGIEEAKESYICEARDLPMFGCVSEETVVGFLTLRLHNAVSAEVHVIGVLPSHSRKGIGTGLVRHAEKYALEHGIRFLSVKTLSPRREDANYEGTRNFYQAVGFVPLMELSNLWGPDLPCLLMVKNIDQ
jgi:GNAT superfamily N-acetyltransferase